MVIIPNEINWRLATNFLRASASASAVGPAWSEAEVECRRYDRINRRLAEAQGQSMITYTSSTWAAQASNRHQRKKGVFHF